MSRMPKRIKFRKQQRGVMKGRATGGNYVAYGDYGLQALETHWVSARQLEAGRVAAMHFLRAAVTSSPTIAGVRAILSASASATIAAGDLVNRNCVIGKGD